MGTGSKAFATTFTADCGLNALRLQIKGSIQHQRLGYQFIFLGQRAWARERNGSGPWSRWTQLTGEDVGSSGLLLIYFSSYYGTPCPLRALRQEHNVAAPPNIMKLSSASKSSPPMWHLRVKTQGRSLQGTPNPAAKGQLDLYVDEATHHWVHVGLASLPKRKQDTVKYDARYSGFNEVLNINPPAIVARGGLTILPGHSWLFAATLLHTPRRRMMANGDGGRRG